MVTVTTNGLAFPGTYVVDDGCCSPDPIVSFGRYEVPRIAVAHTDIGPTGAMFAAQVDSAFIISWEGVYLFNEGNPNALDFQMVLYEHGAVELRWGDGNPIASNFAAGLEDDEAGVLAPATDAPFNSSFGPGVSSQWPANQCRAFEVIDGGYRQAIQ